MLVSVKYGRRFSSAISIGAAGDIRFGVSVVHELSSIASFSRRHFAPRRHHGIPNSDTRIQPTDEWCEIADEATADVLEENGELELAHLLKTDPEAFRRLNEKGRAALAGCSAM